MIDAGNELDGNMVNKAKLSVSQRGAFKVGKLDRENPVPLYLQIRQHLVVLISDWPDPAEKFPSDEELAKAFGVAKATVRQAIADLTRSGLLIRKRGAGTYVVPPLVEKLRPNEGMDEKYQLAGGAVVHKLHNFSTRTPTAREATTLGIEGDEQVLSLRRIRSVAQVPIAIDDRVMSVDRAIELNFTEAKAEKSIIDLVRQLLGLSRASWELQARLAGQNDAVLLQILPTDPVLVRQLTYFDQNDLPILTGETRHRSDMLRCGFEMDFDNKTFNDDIRSWTGEALLAVPEIRSAS